MDDVPVQARVILRRVAAGGDAASARAHRRSHAAQVHQSVRMPMVRSVGRVKVMTVVITHGRIGVIVWRQRARVTEHGLQVSGDVRRRAGLVTPGTGVDERALPVSRLLLQAVRVGEVKSRRQGWWSVGSLDAPPAPVIAFFEHVVESRIQRPEVPFFLPAVLPGNLHETLVEAQIVPDAVLPSLFVLFVVWKLGYNEAVDVIQRQLLILAFSDGHCNESHVRIRRLFRCWSGCSIPCCGTLDVLCGLTGLQVPRPRAAIHEMGLRFVRIKRG